MTEVEHLTDSVPFENDQDFTHWSKWCEIAFSNHVITLVQDPESFVLGTTVWDGSKCLIKYFEKNPNLYSKRTLQKKRCLELGAGCGLAGIAFALMGGDVLLTDIAPVLAFLKQNVHENTKGRLSCGNANVKEYTWGSTVDDLNPPFDYIIAADVIYEKEYVPSLIKSILALSDCNTTIIISNERRCNDVYEEFFYYIKNYFSWKRVGKRDLNLDYYKDSLEIFICKKKTIDLPEEMMIASQEKFTVHPLHKLKDTNDYDSDLWKDLLE